MARRKRYDVFVSYSHKDADIVKPLVQVLHLAKRRVFWDEIIEPGQEWTAEIEVALAASDVIVIMWCCDSAASEWVTREITTARTLGKPLTPIRLCAYPLQGAVLNFQAINLSKNLQHGCDCASKEEQKERERREREAWERRERGELARREQEAWERWVREASEVTRQFWEREVRKLWEREVRKLWEREEFVLQAQEVRKRRTQEAWERWEREVRKLQEREVRERWEREVWPDADALASYPYLRELPTELWKREEPTKPAPSAPADRSAPGIISRIMNSIRDRRAALRERRVAETISLIENTLRSER